MKTVIKTLLETPLYSATYFHQLRPSWPPPPRPPPINTVPHFLPATQAVRKQTTFPFTRALIAIPEMSALLFGSRATSTAMMIPTVTIELNPHKAGSWLSSRNDPVI